MPELDCWGVPMSFRSKELIHYFYQACSNLDIVPKKMAADMLASIAQHPDALQNTLLFAGLHYAWTSGDLNKYEETFLFHKVQTIRMLHQEIENVHKAGLMVCIKQVSMLCLTECSSGNVAAAEAHLNGLISLVDLMCPLAGNGNASPGINEELAHKYLIMAHDSVQGVRGRSLGSRSLHNIFREENATGFPAFVSLIRRWNTRKIGCLDMLLNAMKLLPFFFVVRPTSETCHGIDGSLIVRHLKNMTLSADLTDTEGTSYEPTPVWTEGSVSRLHHAIVSSHITSLAGPGENTSPDSTTSWSSICIVSGLYSHCVLGLSDQNEPIDIRLLRRFLFLLAQDLDRQVDRMNADPSDLWFWKAFVGAYSIATHQMYARGQLEELEKIFDDFIRRWGRATGVIIWEEAQLRLTRVAWPLSKPQELGVKVWVRVMLR